MRGIECRAVPVVLTVDIGLCLEQSQDFLPRAIALPTYKPVIASLPRAVAFGEVATRSPGFQPPNNAVENPSMLNVGVTAVWIARQIRMQLPPLPFG